MLKYYKSMGKINKVTKMVNKKIKFVPFVYKDRIKQAIEDFKYQNFKKRNKSLVNNFYENDDTLMDGLDDKSSHINPIMK